MSPISELLSANERYASAFTKGDLPMPPGRKLAILTCMDARLHPEKFLGLEEGDAHVIRNAGGRTSDDALRSLIISHELLGTREFMVIHHEDCGMLTFSNDQLRQKLREDMDADASSIDFLPFGNLDESVREDVSRIQHSSLIPNDIPVSGYVYDVRSGRLREIVGAGVASAR